MKHSLILSVGALGALASCWSSDRSGRAWHDPTSPDVMVQLKAPSEMATAWASVEVVPAPEIRFLALVQPDPNHVSPVTARVTGVLIRIQPEDHARRGDTLAVIGQGSRVAGREVAVTGHQDGTWRPRRRQAQIVWQDDTIGVIEDHGYWLAVGAVSDIDAGVIHPGDPASVQFGDDRHTARPAKVELVLRPSASSPYSVDVAVEFRAPEDAFTKAPGPVTVVVTPAGPEDSLAAVPPSAIVQLPPGPAVFVPIGTGIYEARWVSTGPSVHGLVIVREGVTSGTSVVVRGLGPLVEAARDSLAARAATRRR